MKKLFMRLQKKIVADGKGKVVREYINTETGEIIGVKSKMALVAYTIADGIIFGYKAKVKDWKFNGLVLKF